MLCFDYRSHCTALSLSADWQFFIACSVLVVSGDVDGAVRWNLCRKCHWQIWCHSWLFFCFCIFYFFCTRTDQLSTAQSTILKLELEELQPHRPFPHRQTPCFYTSGSSFSTFGIAFFSVNNYTVSFWLWLWLKSDSYQDLSATAFMYRGSHALCWLPLYMQAAGMCFTPLIWVVQSYKLDPLVILIKSCTNQHREQTSTLVYVELVCYISAFWTACMFMQQKLWGLLLEAVIPTGCTEQKSVQTDLWRSHEKLKASLLSLRLWHRSSSSVLNQQHRGNNKVWCPLSLSRRSSTWSITFIIAAEEDLWLQPKNRMLMQNCWWF